MNNVAASLSRRQFLGLTSAAIATAATSSVLKGATPETHGIPSASVSGPRHRFDVCIVGMGVVGMGQALAALKRGKSVAIIGQEWETHGSSVLNFGFCCPVGQPSGVRLQAALTGRKLWFELLKDTGVLLRDCGSILSVQTDAELSVIEGFQPKSKDMGYDTRLLSAKEAAEMSPIIRKDVCKGGLYSSTEYNIDPRQAVPAVLAKVVERGAKPFRSSAREFENENTLVLNDGTRIRADRFILCEGKEPRKLFPKVFQEQGDKLRLCKLHMYKRNAPAGYDMGPMLWCGLSLPFYPAWEKLPGSDKVLAEMNARDASIWKHGVHLFLSQDKDGHFVLGDSHHYGADAMNNYLHEEVYAIIRREFERAFAVPPGDEYERWPGHYYKRMGGAFFLHDVTPSIRIVNGFGGQGMTLGFGVAEQMWSDWDNAYLKTGYEDPAR